MYIYEWESRFFGGVQCGSKEILVLGYDYGKLGEILTLKLVLGSHMLYEVFEKMFI